METSYLILCGQLFDGIKAELQDNMEILVEGKIIKAVGKNLSRPSQVEIVDLSHLTVTPGMIDAHMHSDILRWEDMPQNHLYSDSWRALTQLHTAQRSLERGFTTTRCMPCHTRDYGAVDVKKLISAGVFSGARLVVAAHMLGSTGSHADFSQAFSSNPYLSDQHQLPTIGSGVDYFREQVRREVKYGSDFIKIMLSGGFFSPNDSPVDQQLSDDELIAIIDTAHGLGKSVTAHVYHPPLIQKLAKFGIDGIEHGSLMDDETAEVVEKAGLYLVPTFLPYDDIIRFDAEKLAKFPLEMQTKLKEYGERLKSGRQVIIKSKIKLGYGTDMVAVHQCYESGYEYASWLKSGIDPFRALKAATSVNAEILELDKYIGSIEPGKYADIAAWARDLLHDPDALLECSFVMKEGAIYPALHN